MKRGKDEEKMMGPMFPRLHVNDTEKGGPRAPPRNKMALYEQLSIPSQRFSHGVLPHTANNTASNSVPPSSQGGGNERGVFFSRQMSSRHNEKQYSQYTDLNTPLDQVEQRKKLDEDDYRVPIFIHSVPSQECAKYTDGAVKEKLSSFNPSSFNHSLSFQQDKDNDMLECSLRQEGKNQQGENLKEFVVGRTKAISNSSDRQSTAVLEEHIAANKRKFSSSVRALPEDSENIVYDLSNESNDSESCEEGSCGLQMENLERTDSVSETSILDSVSGPDMTPDDVVGIIGQKHFWKARRAIANQQRVFAVQVFELHRLIKVQKLVAASPHILLEDSSYLGKPIKPSPRKKLQLDYTIKAIPDISKQKLDPEKANHKKECSAENTLDKKSPLLDQSPVLPSPLINNPPAPSNCSDHNSTPWGFNQPQGHHWLIPVMTPSEGLVYKPYPGPGFAGHPYGGCGPPGSNPVVGNFVIPGYGAPPPSHHYQLPSYPPPGPHSYFPHYGMPIMNASAFSGSSVEQMNPSAIPGHFSAGEAHFTMPNQKNGPVPDMGLHGREDIEVQASTGSSRSERKRVSRVTDERNMLPLFPTSPATETHNTVPQVPGPERPSPTRVIKVVPHNAISASESAARIFLSIQEERKQYDSA
ncbi:hypothetical protein BUALT_Bualt10G0121400 [Buddleja alternifolia]|uniref:Early flowering 3 n=1 Tax=Buddleja alternifolia TaxID=168488 RepID=A0AAV6WXC1_9LAMI|nr:hypothetical protein BUALT_Bualt10G0121400 [Buddleja alternifolia]